MAALRKHYQRLLGILVALTIGATSVSAANFLNSNSSPLQPLINLIGSFFNITFTDSVQVGVTRFAIFLILFTVINYAARTKIWTESGDTGAGALAKKTSNIVAALVALAIAWLLPKGFILGMPMVFLAFALPLCIAALSFFITRKKDSDGKDRDVQWWWHIIGVILIMTAMFILFIFWSPDAGVLIKEVTGNAREILDELFAGLFLILSIMLLVHIFMAASGPLGNAWDWAKGKIGGGGGDDTVKTPKDPKETKPKDPVEELEETATGKKRPGKDTLPLPNRVKNLKAIPNTETDNIELSWDPRPDVEQVEEYIIQRRTVGSPNYTPNYTNGRLKAARNAAKDVWAWTKNIAQYNIGGGWLEVGKSTTPQYQDTKETLNWFRYWTYGAGTTFNPSARYEYRVCARNRKGKGDWSAPAYIMPSGKAKVPTPGTPGGPETPNPGAPAVHSFANELEDLQTKMVDLKQKLDSAEEIADLAASAFNKSTIDLALTFAGSGRGVDLRERQIPIQQNASQHDFVDLMREFRKRYGIAQQAFNGVNQAFQSILNHENYKLMPAQELYNFRNKLTELRTYTASSELLGTFDAAVIV